MNKKLLLAAIAVGMSVMSGCASVPMASEEETAQAKEFAAPAPDMAGVYIYRHNNAFGAALKKSIWVDEECVGESAKGVFFYHEVEGDKDHTVSTESEFSPNVLTLPTRTGELYFVEQYIKPGVFVGGADLRATDEETGKDHLSELRMAQKGNCGGSQASAE